MLINYYLNSLSGGYFMLKKSLLKNFLLLLLLFGLLIGCAHQGKTKSEQTEPPQREEEKIIEEVKLEPQRIEPEIPQVEITETEIEPNFVQANYPGIEGKFLESSMLKDVHFALDQADLSPQARQTLTENVKLLNKFPKAKIQIEGHCDERGSTDYNLALGEKRAASVKNYLTSLDISLTRLSTISYGEEMPLNTSHNEEAWKKIDAVI